MVRSVLALLTEEIHKQVNDSSFISVLSDVLKRKSVNTNNGISSNSWTQTRGLEVPSNEGMLFHRNLEATRNLVHKSSTLNNEEKEITCLFLQRQYT